MSRTMFLGRVVLPVVGLAVAVSLTWSSVRTMIARTDVSKRLEPVGSTARTAGRIIAEGRIVAYPGAEVTVSTEVLGTIISVPAYEKKAVRKGDLLLELRDDDVKAALQEARFRLIEAEAGVLFVGARSRLEQALPSAAGKPPRADDRTEEQTIAVARRDAAKAAVSRLEAEAVKYRITAPIEGIIVARYVDPGETVTPGSRLITIVDLGRLRVEAEVDEFDISRISLAAHATITAAGYDGRGWRAQVEEIPDAVVGRQTLPDDPGRPIDTQVLRLKVAFREPSPLKLGQRVEVEIDVGNPH
jgi:HlyD family secretion protein